MANWIGTYGNMIFFFAQIIYWFGILLFFGYAVAQYKRWVNFQMGVGHSGSGRDEDTVDESDDEDESVSADEFVD